MIELIVLVVIGLIVIWVDQSPRRSKLSEEERRKKPTIFEAAADSARKAADTTAQMREDRLYALKRDTADRRQAAVDRLAAKHAAFYAQLEQDLNKDPRRKAYFEKIRARMMEGEDAAAQVLDSAYGSHATQSTAATPNAAVPSHGDNQTDVVFTARVTATRALNAVGSTADAVAATVDPKVSLGSSLSPSQLEIKRFCLKRSVPYLVHFTQCSNLASILEHGLRSKLSMEAKGIDHVINDEMRLDGRPNYISASIAFPNSSMFFKHRMNNKSKDWCVLLLDPSVMWEKDCLFFDYNAAAKKFRGKADQGYRGIEALMKMFDDPHQVGRNGLSTFHPTHEQAEVMVEVCMEARYIREVVFEDDRAMRNHISEDIRDVYGNALLTDKSRNSISMRVDRDFFKQRSKVLKSVYRSPDFDDQIPF